MVRVRGRVRVNVSVRVWLGVALSSRGISVKPVPGIHVRVVNSYAATSLLVSVTAPNKDDLPTLGKPGLGIGLGLGLGLGFAVGQD